MINNLNASGYEYANIIYEKELQRILQGVYLCYTMMINDNIKLSNNENEIRDKLFFDYLNNDKIRNSIGLTEFLFIREGYERTDGRVDIQIKTIKTFIKTEYYYNIECKRINKIKTRQQTGLNAQYIKNGIYRFVSNYYTTYCGVNAMLGFVVEKIDINDNINNINFLLQKHYSICNTVKYLEVASFIPHFEYHYRSDHKDSDNKIITLYHLMFDFSHNITIDN